MQALIRNSSQQTQLQQIPEPTLSAPDEVKIRIAYCTLCRDDMRVEDELNIYANIGILGHEASGVIVELGDHAKAAGFSVGDRVAMMPLDSCGKCSCCMAQQPQYCPEAHPAEGVIAEYVIKRHTQLLHLPDDITFPQANLMEPVGGALAALGKVRLDFSSRVLLIGGGFMGLVLARLLRLQGVALITVLEPRADRRKLALAYGADVALAPDDPSLQLTLLQQTDFMGFDTVIEASGRQEMAEMTLPFVRRGGTMLLFSFFDSQSKLSLQTLDMYVRNISLVWSCLCDMQTMREAGALVHRLKLDRLITAEYPFSQSALAFARYQSQDEIKIGISMNPQPAPGEGAKKSGA